MCHLQYRLSSVITKKYYDITNGQVRYVVRVTNQALTKYLCPEMSLSFSDKMQAEQQTEEDV